MTIAKTAGVFFDACETRKGRAACARFFTPDASFPERIDALAGVETIEAYAGWMQGLLEPVSNGRNEHKGFVADRGRGWRRASPCSTETITSTAGRSPRRERLSPPTTSVR